MLSENLIFTKKLREGEGEGEGEGDLSAFGLLLLLLLPASRGSLSPPNCLKHVISLFWLVAPPPSSPSPLPHHTVRSFVAVVTHEMARVCVGVS
jgi:hypothetical protein